MDAEAPDGNSTFEMPVSSFGPLGPIPRVALREARLGARLARLGEAGGIGHALDWLAQAVGLPIEIDTPELLWNPSATKRTGVIAHFVWRRFATRLGVGVETPIAHAIVDRLLGFDRLPEESRLQLSPVEWGILTMVFAETLRRLSAEEGPLGAWDLRLDRVSPDPFDMVNLGRVVTIAWPISIGSARGVIRLWLPDAVVARWLLALPDPSETNFDPERFSDLAAEWCIEAGRITLQHGLSLLEIGATLPLDDAGLPKDSDRPTRPVTLSVETSDRAGQFLILTGLMPGSGESNVRIRGPIQYIPTPREALPMPHSKSSGDPAAAGAPTFDVPVTVVVELGRINLTLARLAEVREGDVVPLGRHARDPVELTSGGKLVARGELVELGSELGVRVTTVYV